MKRSIVSLCATQFCCSKQSVCVLSFQLKTCILSVLMCSVLNSHSLMLLRILSDSLYAKLSYYLSLWTCDIAKIEDYGRSAGKEEDNSALPVSL